MAVVRRIADNGIHEMHRYPGQGQPANKEFFNVLGHIASHLPGFIYQLQRDKNNNFRYTCASQSVETLFGITPADVEANIYQP